MNADRWLSTTEIMSELELSRTVVNQLIDSGKLKGRKTPGGHRQARLSTVKEYGRDMEDPTKWKGHHGDA